MTSAHLARSRESLDLAREQAQAALDNLTTFKESPLTQDIVRAIWKIEDAWTHIDKAYKNVGVFR